MLIKIIFIAIICTKILIATGKKPTEEEIWQDYSYKD